MTGGGRGERTVERMGGEQKWGRVVTKRKNDRKCILVTVNRLSLQLFTIEEHNKKNKKMVEKVMA